MKISKRWPQGGRHRGGKARGGEPGGEGRGGGRRRRGGRNRSVTPHLVVDETAFKIT